MALNFSKAGKAAWSDEPRSYHHFTGLFVLYILTLEAEHQDTKWLVLQGDPPNEDRLKRCSYTY